VLYNYSNNTNYGFASTPHLNTGNRYMICHHHKTSFLLSILVIFLLHSTESQAVDPLNFAPAKTDTVPGGTISSDTQWPSDLYYISSDLYISEDVTLTIASGAVLKFGSGCHLLVYGGLIADNVVFTTWSDDAYEGDSNGDGASTGYPGQWPGIRFYSTATNGSLSNCLVRYAGSYAVSSSAGIAVTGGDHSVDLINVTVEHTHSSGDAFNLVAHGTVSGCVARNNLGFGYRVPANRVGELSQNSNTQSSNGYQNFIRVYTGTISNTTTWPNTYNYYVESDMFVEADAILTVASGTVMKFGNGDHLLVYGGLIADNVVFTTWSDDAYVGDSNGDGASDGYPGQWPGIRFYSTATNGSLSNCLVRYAGSSVVGSSAGVSVTGGDQSVDLINVTVEHTHSSGVAFELTVPSTMAGCIARNNEGDAIKVTSSGTSLSTTDIYSDSGIGLEYTLADTLVAENCYWGHPSGPQHPDNPGGLGAVITGNVDFTPWALSPNTLILDTTIQGIVTNSSTGLPVDGAQVVLSPLFPGSSTIADELGAWSLSIPAGSGYDLAITAPGYLDYLASDLSFIAGQVYQFDVDLPHILSDVIDGDLPTALNLSQNYPNPFNPMTTIQFSLPRAEHVSLRIYNAQGRLVKTLVNGVLPVGLHDAIWVADDDTGRPVASGIYLYRLETATETNTKVMTVIK
jgi:carboxypeptidase family protein/flagellar hook capping protein FlgD